MEPRRRTRHAAGALALATCLTLSGCAAGSFGSSGQDGPGSVTITFLTLNGEQSVASANAIITAFTAANPDVNVKLDTRPGGSDGDNSVKTKLATGEMAEVFLFNTGSLMQTLKPERNLLPLDDQPWVADLEQSFADSVKGADGKLYGGPIGTAFGGGVLYNIPLYQKLGLSIPVTWEEFMANNEKVKAAGVTPFEQTFGDSWTAQLTVLADYYNVEAAVPDFAAAYTAGTKNFSNTPAALLGFEHLQQLRDKGYLNSDFASALMNDGLKAVADGTAAHYPQIGTVVSGLEGVAPGKSNDVGIFAMPGPDAAKNGLTVWPGDGIYIPEGVAGDRLKAAKDFVAFIATQAGCDAIAAGSPPQGPFLVKTCKLPTDVSQVAKDTQKYFDDAKTTPALEFKSPIKGPALEQICVQIGTGQIDATKAADLYDRDVKKQAQQLGLPGWD